jgi:hypothetical protein
LTTLPATLGQLPRLEKLDLRWNSLAAPPVWVNQLVARGCVVYL